MVLGTVYMKGDMSVDIREQHQCIWSRMALCFWMSKPACKRQVAKADWAWWTASLVTGM